jgi:hypothetical protein
MDGQSVADATFLSPTIDRACRSISTRSCTLITSFREFDASVPAQRQGGS